MKKALYRVTFLSRFESDWNYSVIAVDAKTAIGAAMRLRAKELKKEKREVAAEMDQADAERYMRDWLQAKVVSVERRDEIDG